MNGLTRALQGIATRLQAAQRRWALVGGFAVSARAEPRTTRDIDVAVAVADDSDAEQLIHTLQMGGAYVLAGIVEQTRVKRLATARLRPTEPRASRVFVDLLLASSGIEAEVAADADLLEVLPGLALPVARIGHLIALKVLARDDRNRPQDYDDLRALLAEATPRDIEDAKAAVLLIEQRGYHRGRQLFRSLEEILSDGPKFERIDR